MSETTLGDYVELQRGNTYKSALLGRPGPVLLGLGTIQRNGGFRGENLKSYGGDTDPRMLLLPGDVYVSLKDVTQAADLLGAVAQVPARVALGRLTQDTVKLTFKENAPRSLIYWVLRSPQYRAYCRAHATGTTNLGLPRDDFLAFPVPQVTAERRAIVDALQALDDKIELSRRMNETLEAMARAIFRDWFVDFGPTRAKMEGRASYLAPELWSLFPDTINGATTLPEGWMREGLLAHSRLISGGTPKTSIDAYWEGDISWASAKDVSQCSDAFLISTERSITPRGLEESATRLVPKGSTVVVARGATTGRFCLFGIEMAMNQTCYALTSDAGRPYWLNCTFAALVDELVRSAHGSVFDTITTNTLGGGKIVVADTAILNAFEATISPLFERVLHNVEEAQALTATRDYLLPKLMSGEIAVADTKTNAERVA